MKRLCTHSDNLSSWSATKVFVKYQFFACLPKLFFFTDEKQLILEDPPLYNRLIDNLTADSKLFDTDSSTRM